MEVVILFLLEATTLMFIEVSLYAVFKFLREDIPVKEMPKPPHLQPGW